METDRPLYLEFLFISAHICTEEYMEVCLLADTLCNIHPYFRHVLESMVSDASN